MSTPDSGASLEKSLGSHWALLIGVNDYADGAISNLKVCTSDVQAVYDLLTTHGYEPDRVRLLLSPSDPNPPATRVGIFAALNSAAQAASENDLLLFYFSGHGINHDGQAYLLPTDTSYAAIADTAINLNRVKQIIQDSDAQAKVMILDACHSGAQIGKASPGMTEDFMRHVFEEAEGLAILASCKQRQVSWEWPERGGSVFTHYLLEGLLGAADFDQKGFVTVGDINRYVTDRVKTWAVQRSRVQTPSLQCAVAGDIVLISYSSDSFSTDVVTVASTSNSMKESEAGFKMIEEPALTRSERAPVHRENPASTITWLHLSDLHAGKPYRSWDSRRVIEALVNDLKRMKDLYGIHPDFIFFTGDAAFGQIDQGPNKTLVDQFALAQDFFEAVRCAFEPTVPRSRIFLVPGNHDVNRLVVGDDQITWLDGNEDPHKICELMERKTPQWRRYMDRLTAYRKFLEDSGYSHLLEYPDHLVYGVVRDLGGVQVGVAGFNTAWSCCRDSKVEKGRLWMGSRWQLEHIRSRLEGADITIALLHHPT